MIPVVTYHDCSGLPEPTTDDMAYLYVVDLANGVKVGVTSNPRDRLRQLRDQAGGCKAFHLAHMHYVEARSRENIIARMFGGPTKVKGRFSEYLLGEVLAEAVALMTLELPPRDCAYGRSLKLRKAIVANHRRALEQQGCQP